METQRIKVTRTVEGPNGKDMQRATSVLFRRAQTMEEVLQLSQGDANKVLECFNAGRWADIRSRVSVALASKSIVHKALDKIMEGLRATNPHKSEAELRNMALTVSGITDNAGEYQSIPAETDEADFMDTIYEDPEPPAPTTPQPTTLHPLPARSVRRAQR